MKSSKEVPAGFAPWADVQGTEACGTDLGGWGCRHG